MSNRQKIGLRKRQPRKTRAPGRKRRELLVDSARELLGERDIEEISFRDIAARAAIPEGSAYHFFANRYDIFTELAGVLSRQFVVAHRRAIPVSRRASKRDAAEYLVDVGARVYDRSPAARQLLIGGKAPFEVKQADRSNDRAVAAAMHASFMRYFDIPDTDDARDAFYLFIEITDLFFMLSVVEQGRISAEMLQEAKRAGVAYLASRLSFGSTQAD